MSAIIGNGQIITASTIDGTTFYTTVRRGIEYTAHLTAGGNWWLGTTRLALGRNHIGGGRYYSDIDALAAGCKAFADLPLMLEVSTTTVN